MQQILNTPNTQRNFDFDRAYYENRCRAMNEAIGNFDDGYNCERCRNKGFLYTMADDGEILSSNCPDCYNVRTSLRLLKSSGLEDKTFENFVVKSDWQGGLLRTVKEFAADTSGKWLFIGGQSGCGKTHLCTAALREIILTQNKAVRVLKWVEGSRSLKASVNDSGYTNEANAYKGAEVLYIDDMFKGGGNAISNADLRLAFELLDYRYLKGLTTVVSSEFSFDNILRADEAIAGRIREKTGKYLLHVKKDSGKNQRL